MKKNTAQQVTAEPLDWHRADIIAALKKRGWTIRASQCSSDHYLRRAHQTLPEKWAGYRWCAGFEAW